MEDEEFKQIIRKRLESAKKEKYELIKEIRKMKYKSEKLSDDIKKYGSFISARGKVRPKPKEEPTPEPETVIEEKDDGSQEMSLS